jgi:acyl-CoA reductase-like NAD-dependent aldehyde dehydrogenase
MKTLPVHDKVSGEVIAELPVDDDAAVGAAAERARSAQAGWSALGARERGRLLKRARRNLVAQRSEILRLLERETGKARFDVVGEFMNVCLDIGYYSRRAPRWLRPQRVGTRPLVGKRGRIHYKPRGVVGIISPWNAPLTLALGDAIPALLAGNTVIIKPSELTPLAVRGAVEALNRGLPAGVLQTVIGEGDTGAALVDRADMICVTGSPQTGRRVMERASRRLTPVLLELGGKDPMIVLEDADLERAARAAAWGACMMTGQVCMSIERIYVVDSIAAEFKHRLIEQMQTLRTGPTGAGADVDYGPFTSARQVEIVERHIADAVNKGGRVLTGGRRVERDGGGIYFEPTVVEADHSMLLMKEETFGPVVGVMSVRDEDEAVALANDSPYGLNASVWTRDIKRGIAVAERLQTGSACVDECVVTAGLPELPFGGIKQSGIGTRHGGAEGVRQFCVHQALLIEPRKRKTEMNWFPYSARQAGWIERAIGLMFRL